MAVWFSFCWTRGFATAKKAATAMKAERIRGVSFLKSWLNCFGRSAFQSTRYRLWIKNLRKTVSHQITQLPREGKPLHLAARSPQPS
ncbi:MAG: hypothetical protein DRZ90_15575 [Spirochaetes bacterium]|nr:MAG: hypothetical protein DRZ90_15575 [Spirochaetota bacterium]